MEKQKAEATGSVPSSQVSPSDPYTIRMYSHDSDMSSDMDGIKSTPRKSTPNSSPYASCSWVKEMELDSPTSHGKGGDVIGVGNVGGRFLGN